MTTALDKAHSAALTKIGTIEPWYEKDVASWVFENEAYPAVRAAGGSVEEVIEIYPLYLKDYLEEELKGNVSPLAKSTFSGGRGGSRPGAGRPKGSKRSESSTIIRLPLYVVDWLKTPENRAQLESLAKQG
jgi:hypothetical protein